MSVVQFPAKSGSSQQANFAFNLGETVDVMIRGEIVERIENAHGIQYLIKQVLESGKVAYQRIKQEHTFEVDEDVA